ncbi:MAG: hypothetical protein RR073_05095 [Clostridia bacterium]
MKIKKLTSRAKFCTIFGYCFGGFMAIGFIVFLVDREAFANNSTSSNIIGFVVCFAIAFFLIYMGYDIKQKLSRFKTYLTLIESNNCSIQSLASATKKTEDFVMKDIQQMIDKGYFEDKIANAKLSGIVIENNMVVLKSPNQTPLRIVEKSIKCKNCGATNIVSSAKQTKCEYCGSSLN